MSNIKIHKELIDKIIKQAEEEKMLKMYNKFLGEKNEKKRSK